MDTIIETEPMLEYSSLNNFMPSKWCIFKVPDILRRHNEKAYEPNAFSFGPFHHGRPHLKEAEKIKLHYLRGLIARAPTNETSYKKLFVAVKKLEGEARKCYATPICYSVDEFVEILVLDGCFIIEFLRKVANVVPSDADDPMVNRSCMSQLLLHDLILLENQIPWLVLDCLFQMTSSLPNSLSLTELADTFFDAPLPFEKLPMGDINHESKHILDLLRNWLILPPEKKRGKRRGRWEQIPSATSLVEAGIKFKKSDSTNLLDIEFSNGVLKMPRFMVDEVTEDFFRNLISFEQCHSKCTDEISSYVVLLDNLVSTTRDMNILYSNGIIYYVNSDMAIRFFNNLHSDARVRECNYIELCVKVNAYRQRWWRRLRAMYMHHFTNPWAIVGQFVGAIILVLTTLQTIFTVKE